MKDFRPGFNLTPQMARLCRRALQAVLLCAVSALILSCAAAPTTAPAAAPAQPSAGAATASPFAPLAQPVKIVVAQATLSMLFAPLYVAEAKGYFTEERLEVERVVAGGGAKVIAALVGRSVQFGCSIFGDTVGALRENQPVVLVAGIANQYQIQIVMRKEVAQKLGVTSTSPAADKMKALKGLKISITSPGSGTDLLVRYLMRQVGLDPDRDADIVPMGTLDPAVAAMKAGRIDAAAVAPPATQQMILGDMGILLLDPAGGDVPALKNVHYGECRALRSYADANPQIVAAFVRAIAKAEHFVATDKVGARDAMRAFFSQMDARTFEAAWESRLNDLPKDPVFPLDAVQRALDFENSFAEKKLTLPVESIVDNRFAEAAVRALR